MPMHVLIFSLVDFGIPAEPKKTESR